MEPCLEWNNSRDGDIFFSWAKVGGGWDLAGEEREADVVGDVAVGEYTGWDHMLLMFRSLSHLPNWPFVFSLLVNIYLWRLDWFPALRTVLGAQNAKEPNHFASWSFRTEQ